MGPGARLSPTVPSCPSVASDHSGADPGQGLCSSSIPDSSVGSRSGLGTPLGREGLEGSPGGETPASWLLFGEQTLVITAGSRHIPDPAAKAFPCQGSWRSCEPAPGDAVPRDAAAGCSAVGSGWCGAPGSSRRSWPAATGHRHRWLMPERVMWLLAASLSLEVPSKAALAN